MTTCAISHRPPWYSLTRLSGPDRLSYLEGSHRARKGTASQQSVAYDKRHTPNDLGDFRFSLRYFIENFERAHQGIFFACNLSTEFPSEGVRQLDIHGRFENDIMLQLLR